jgi:DNA invertase Pin-like site-specific DNA recombinase/ssDNA-binding Zn-finger/Zn-ribbon topoisomerase 1
MSAVLYLRYSTTEQSAGQSEQRQTQGAERWCRERGVKLTKVFKDLGISGGKSADDRKGLSALLNDFSKGGIPQYLLIEDVDRLSRMLPLDSLNLISKILDYGVTMVSLRDNQVLTKDNWQNSQSFLILSLKTTLANEERQKRIFRGKSAWKQKRIDSHHKIYTRKVPSWLAVKDDKIVAIPEHIRTVKKMFKLANDGLGIVSIIRLFNEEGVKSFRGKDWNKAIVHNTLTGEAVLGHFQPKTSLNGKRVEDGEMIPHYFPRVISDELYYSVQAKLKQRNKYKGAGFRYTKNPAQNNLFAGLIKCAKCGASLIHLVRSRHGYSYLVCGNAHKHKKCDYKTVATNILEECFHVFLMSHRVLPAFQKPINSAEATRLQVEGVKAQLAKFMSLIENADDLPPKTILKRIQDLELKQEELEKKLRENLNEEIQASKRPELFEEFCREMETNLDDPLGRVRIASLLKDLVARIVVNPEKCWMKIHWADGDVDGLRWDKRRKEFFHLTSQGHEDFSQDAYSLTALYKTKRKNINPQHT